MYENMTRNVMRAFRDHFRGRRLVYRSTLQGHYQTCQNHQSTVKHNRMAEYVRPLLLPAAKFVDGPRKEIDFWGFHLSVYHERSWISAAEGHGVNMSFLNVTHMMGLRIDGKQDCIHYCLLGPHLWVARILLSTVFAP